MRVGQARLVAGLRPRAVRTMGARQFIGARGRSWSAVRWLTALSDLRDVRVVPARARWYTTKTEPSYDDMAVKLRRVIITARFRSPRPEQAVSRSPRKKPEPFSQPGPPREHDHRNCET